MNNYQEDTYYVLFNTFFALLTQDEQVRCFENVARHLSADGVFVIEAADSNKHISAYEHAR